MDDQNADAVYDARDWQEFAKPHGSESALYCLICSTVIFVDETYGIKAESDCWLHEDGDCEALTLVILPLVKVTFVVSVP